jgi:catechol 2,3-dioxygenase
MSTLPADARIGDVSLTVANLDRSIAFYTDILGFQVMTRETAAATLGAGGSAALVRLSEMPGAIGRPRRASGLYHFAILVPSRAALGRSLRRLAGRRWPLTGASDHLVSEALYLDDPDGLGIEIYRDRPRDDWQQEAGEVVMATEPLNLDDVADEPGADLPWSGLDAETAIGHVHLHVPDLASAEQFYCDGVGFTPTLRRYPGALFVAAGGYHHHLGLNVWAGLGAPPPPPNAVGLQAFTVEAPGVSARAERDDATGVTVTVRASDRRGPNR